MRADAWGRRVIQAKLGLPEAGPEIDYLLNGPDDGAGNRRFGKSPEPPGAARPFNRTHQLQALADAARSWKRTAGFRTRCWSSSSWARAWAGRARK